MRSLKESIINESKAEDKLKSIFELFVDSYNSINRKKTTYDSIVHHTHLDKDIFIGKNGLNNDCARFSADYMVKSKVDRLFKLFEDNASRRGFKTKTGIIDEGVGYREIRYVFIDDSSISSVRDDEYTIGFRNAIRDKKVKGYKGTPLVILAEVYGDDFSRYNVEAYATSELANIELMNDYYDFGNPNR